jgi:hypothetical protein
MPSNLIQDGQEIACNVDMIPKVPDATVSNAITYTRIFFVILYFIIFLGATRGRL